VFTIVNCELRPEIPSESHAISIAYRPSDGPDTCLRQTAARFPAQGSDHAEVLGRKVDAVLCEREELVHLAFRDRQGRAQHHGIADGAHDEPVREAMIAAMRADIACAVELGPG